jgi:hypothetical protein
MRPFGQGTYAPCPPLVADLPAPSNPSKSESIKTAAKDVVNVIKFALKKSSSYGQLDSSTSFSLDVFSTHESRSILTYEYSVPDLKSAQNCSRK